jgi:hypothetical protein
VDQVVIIVATGNLPPVANAGPDQTVTTGQLVTLNGTGSSDPTSQLIVSLQAYEEKYDSSMERCESQAESKRL